jgi:hypothetical protein
MTSRNIYEKHLTCWPNRFVTKNHKSGHGFPTNRNKMNKNNKIRFYCSWNALPHLWVRENLVCLLDDLKQLFGSLGIIRILVWMKLRNVYYIISYYSRTEQSKNDYPVPDPNLDPEIHRIHMFLGLPDQNPSISKQK